MTHGRRVVLAALLGMVFHDGALAAGSAAACRTAKALAAGAYELCLLRAAVRPTAIGPSACRTHFATRWQKAETRSGGSCPTTGDEAAIAAQVEGDVAAIIAALSSSTTSTSTTTTTSSTGTTSPTGGSCGTYPGCGGTCPAGMSCWATTSAGPTTACQCLPAVATPCGSTGGPIAGGALCGGSCPSGQVCSTIDVDESLNFTCGCMPAGQAACLTFSGVCSGGGCPAGMSCAADPLQLFACKCQ